MLCNDFILHFIINRVCGAYLCTDTTLTFNELAAIFRINSCFFRNSLRKRNANSSSKTKSFIIFIVSFFAWAFLHTKAATSAYFLIHRGNNRLNFHRTPGQKAQDLGGGCLCLRYRVGDILRALATSGNKHPIVQCGYGIELDVPLHEKTIRPTTNGEDLGHLLGIRSRLQGIT